MMSPNLLGDLRAEADHRMLDGSFVETPDYKTLLESRERSVVVGRRGTGKSAYTYMLGRHWTADHNARVVHVMPEEDQLIGLRALVETFGEKFQHLKAGSRIAWRYALLLDMACAVESHHRCKKVTPDLVLMQHVGRWKGLPAGTSGRLRHVLRTLRLVGSPADRIGELAGALQVNELQEAVRAALEAANLTCVLLIDKLDEGYEPDPVGVAIANALIQASIDINTRIPSARSTVFVRDNIFRAVAQLDADYSRNIEGQVLRLHWDEHQLLNLVSNRLRCAFRLEQENDLRIWNRCTARELQGRDGFKRCLQLTLYRPRDVLALLNQAFFQASRENRQQIIGDDIETTAKQISQSRLDDLHKEYQAVFPGLQHVTQVFVAGPRELSIGEVDRQLTTLVESDTYPAPVQQHFRVLGGGRDLTRSLHSVGFLGVREPSVGEFVFCHDGRAPTHEFVEADRVLIHPCYWMALELSQRFIEPEQALEIFDEYDIGVKSETPEIRKAKLGSMISALDKIPIGTDGAGQFEEWCLQAVQVLWAGQLRNVELHPNRNATQRRDVVGTNLSEKGVFRRILDDYCSRQVVFEIKNKDDVGVDEYRQMLSYLDGEYGHLGFVVTRASEMELRANGVELQWVRELYHRQPRVLVIRLTGRWLAKLLSKLRSPVKHDHADDQLGKLLDTYVRLYVSGQEDRRKRKSR